jgi:hypothetical protein
MLFYDATLRLERRRRRQSLVDDVAGAAGGKAATDHFKALSD